MGNYANSLSKRFSNRGPDKGFCAICRKHDTLTKDHVPPKACSNVSDVVIRDIFGDGVKQHRSPLVSQGGLHFKTLCGSCNNTLLGTKYDPALTAVVNEIRTYMTRASASCLELPKTQLFDYQPNRFLRSILGHLLAANAVDDVTRTTPEAPLDAALRKYVLEPSEVLDSNIHVYYWLYPYRPKVIMKHCGMGFLGSRGELIYGHVFKFFPFGFWVVWAQQPNSSIRRISLPRLDLEASSIISAAAKLAINFWPLQDSNFPEAPPDDGMWLLTDYLVSQAETRAK